MGSNILLQRRAIERVFIEKPFVVEEQQAYYLDGKRIYLLGVSIGLGTCSDLHGVDIAVFGQNLFEGKPQLQAYDHGDRSLPLTCRGAVLLRKPRPGEHEQDDEHYNHPEPHILRAIEGLEIVADNRDAIHFRSNGKVKLYIPL